jgi:hypothetical protein
MKKNVLSLFVFSAILLTSCGAAAAPYAPDGYANQGVVAKLDFAEEAAPAPAMAPVADGAGNASVTNLYNNPDRIVIKNASRSQVVNDPADAAKKIADLAVAKGGWVVNSNINQSAYGSAGEKYYSGEITIRVPAEDLDQTLVEVEALAVEVRTRQLTGQDVTAEYTDLQSRLRNMQASQSRLYEIMKSADGTEAVAAVEAQLTRVEEQIEVLRGQIQYYDESARFSSITVNLEPFIPSQPIEIGGWHPEGVAKQALEDLVRGLQELVDLIIRLGICGIPVLLLIGLILLPVILVIRARNRRFQAKKS